MDDEGEDQSQYLLIMRSLKENFAPLCSAITSSRSPSHMLTNTRAIENWSTHLIRYARKEPRRVVG